MNVQMAFNLFLVDRESYCSDKSILYYRENILKFMYIYVFFCLLLKKNVVQLQYNNLS